MRAVQLEARDDAKPVGIRVRPLTQSSLLQDRLGRLPHEEQHAQRVRSTKPQWSWCMRDHDALEGRVDTIRPTAGSSGSHPRRRRAVPNVSTALAASLSTSTQLPPIS
jgi:hypothetical protein